MSQSSSPEESDLEIHLKPRQLLLVVSLLAVVSFLAGVGLGRGTWGHSGLAALALALGSCTLFLALVVECGFLLFRRKLGSRLWPIWVLLLAPLAGLVLSYEYYSIPNERRVEAAHEACEELIPRLEAHRRESGTYPARAEPWMDLDRLGVDYLTDDGQAYRLTFQESLEDLSGPLDHVYDSASAKWSPTRRR